jgi:hypothetical protein
VTDPAADAGTETGTSATETTAETGETGDPAEDNHGSIRLEVAPINDDTTIFDGTTEVVATVQYQACLQDFYLNRQVTYQQEGPDGAPVFEAWASRLCSDFADISDCEVIEISQTLIDANAVYSLGVTMKINDASSLAYREIHVGPLPLPAFAECDSGQQPSVEVRQSGLIGKNAGGEQIWRISALPASNTAVANQGAPLRVEVISN